MTEISDKVRGAPAVQVNVGLARQLTVARLADGRITVHDSPACLFRLTLLPQEALDLAAALSRAAGAQ